MSMLTCITCQLAFSEADLQRVHYKSDWHKYNLKRKIIELPPVPLKDFKKKLDSQNALIAKSNEDEAVIGMTCKICNRRFHSYGSHKSHLQSKKHKEAEKRELEVVRKRVAEEQLHIEKDEDLLEEDIYEMEEKAIKKAVAEAKSNLNEPIVLKGDKKAERAKKQAKLELRRKIWCQQQMRLIEEKETNNNEEDIMEEDEGGWEDCSDDDDWEEASDDAESEASKEDDSRSQSEFSSVSETSDVSGILSRIKYDSDADVASVGSHDSKSEQREIGLRECLFCPRIFATADDKVFHMSRNHSFFIPELEFVSQLDGLLVYLGYKIGVGNMCIWCNKSFPSLSAVRSHMVDKGHCRMFVEKEAALEYADFYDFSTSYPDGESEENEDKDGLELMSVDEDVYVPSTEDTAEEEYELVLPSGARIGNRKLMRYYKQSFPTVDRGLASRTSRVNKLLSQYSAIGWHSAGAASAEVKKFRRDITYVQHMKKKHEQKLGRNNNKTMMKHFRCAVMF